MTKSGASTPREGLLALSLAACRARTLLHGGSVATLQLSLSLAASDADSQTTCAKFSRVSRVLEIFSVCVVRPCSTVHMHMHMRHAHVLSNVQCAMCMYVWGFTHFLRGYGIRYLVFRFGILGVLFSPVPVSPAPVAPGPPPVFLLFSTRYTFLCTLHFSMLYIPAIHSPGPASALVKRGARPPPCQSIRR